MDKNFKKGDIVTVKREACEELDNPGELLIVEIRREIIARSIDNNELYSLNDDDIEEVIEKIKPVTNYILSEHAKVVEDECDLEHGQSKDMEIKSQNPENNIKDNG